MKVTHTPSLPERKLVAVLGSGGGIFLPAANGQSQFVTKKGETVPETTSLSDLAKGAGRAPVYEGDSVTLQF